jgi:acetyltransferase-like isoleucine patch superfamily enzyme
MSSQGDSYIDPTARIGFPLRPLQGFVTSNWQPDVAEPQIAGPVYVGPFALIGEGVSLGERVIVEAFCSIGRGTRVGRDSLIIYRASVGGQARIGAECVIGNVVSEHCTIGDRCKVFGRIVHKHEDSTISWDHHPEPEPAVTIADDTFVGFDAIVAGGVTIGPRAYVCAGAIVTRDVPPLHIASGTNTVVHFSQWRGPLAQNPLFQD